MKCPHFAYDAHPTVGDVATMTDHHFSQWQDGLGMCPEPPLWYCDGLQVIWVDKFGEKVVALVDEEFDEVGITFPPDAPSWVLGQVAHAYNKAYKHGYAVGHHSGKRDVQNAMLEALGLPRWLDQAIDKLEHRVEHLENNHD